LKINPPVEHLNEPVLRFARKDFTTLNQKLTVEQALASIRQRGVGEKIVYFYVVDDDEKLVGVVPTRRLLMASLAQPLSELMIKGVIAIPHTATVMEACEVFVLHKFFAFPIVDENRRVVGLVDVGLFTEEVFDIAEREQLSEVFETLGFHVAQVRDASPWRAFQIRFPWLLTTIVSGTFCAFLAGAYHLTLEKSLVIAFFLTLILGLGESVGIQSMTVTIQSLRTTRLSWPWYFNSLAREISTALLLGISCGIVVAAVVLAWQRAPLPALVIGTSVTFCLRHRLERAGGVARAEARPENRRRADHARGGGRLHAVLLFQPGESRAVSKSRSSQPAQWNPAEYAANSAVQQGWARELTAKLNLRGDEHILDVGCGDGKITAELARAVPRGSVVGVDASPEMIAFAKKTFPEAKIPNLKFEIADAREIETVVGRAVPCAPQVEHRKDGGQRTARPTFDLVFSNAALHWVDDHEKFLRGAAAALKPGGRLVVSCGGKGNAHEVFLALRPEMRLKRWREFFRRMPLPYFFYAPADYEKWLPQFGFKIHALKLAPKDAAYAGADGFATWLRATWLPFVQRVPENLREEFIAAVTQRYLAKHPPDAAGNIRVRMVRLEIEAEKV
jgi:magnesium transporter